MENLGIALVTLLALIVGAGLGVGGTFLSRRRRGSGVLISKLLQKHFRPATLSSLIISERKFPFRVRPDLQRALDELLQQGTTVSQFCGIQKDYYSNTLSFSILLTGDHAPAETSPPQYEEVDVGDAEPIRCLKNGLWLLQQGEIRFAVLLGPAERFGELNGLVIQIAVSEGKEAIQIPQRFFKRLEDAVASSQSYRGKILSLEQNEMYSGRAGGIMVHRLRTVAREQVVLPSRTLELLERNVVQFVKQRTRLKDLGQSTRKGLLFYGPPGTGKTHTLHYLASALQGHTTLLITAEQVGLLGEYMSLARLLQPSMVVIEDADLIARERTQMGTCEEVMLNKLLNEMDGLREDADILFVLTTNRPEALEAALAARPGRIDQAIEFPLPDEEGREKLIRLYARNVVIPNEVVQNTVRRTEDVSAAFIKELMRRAVQFQIEREGEGRLEVRDIEEALEEMLFRGGELNLKLLGGVGGGRFGFDPVGSATDNGEG